MSKLDPRIEAVRVQYGLDASDFWELPQKKGTWVAKHSALEVAAAKAGIQFDNPTIIEANSEAGIAVLSVRGEMGDRFEWSTGEASPKNNKNAYPWAMAEKRAKDRVILKLIGIHGLVYSEDEMAGSDRDETPRSTGVNGTADRKSSSQSKKDGDWEALEQEVEACQTLEQLNMLVASRQWQDTVKKMPRAWIEPLQEIVGRARKSFEHPPTKAPNFDNLEPTH
jgi:hypothetical protein